MNQLTDRIDQQIARHEEELLPRFGYHKPLDYEGDTFSPRFDPPVFVVGESLPLLPVPMRMGYPADDAIYLEMGQFDHELIISSITRNIARDFWLRYFAVLDLRTPALRFSFEGWMICQERSVKNSLATKSVLRS